MRKNQRIDDACLQRHAEALARIVPQLGLSDTEAFWKALRRWWSIEKLDEAIAQFAETGSVEAFGSIKPKGKRVRVPSGHWQNRANVEQRLREYVERLGHFPSEGELRAAGDASLCQGIRKYYGGLPAMRTAMGFELLQVPPHHWDAWERVESALRRLIEELGHLPTQDELRARGQHGLIRGIETHGGFPAVRVRLGLELLKKPHRHWQAWEHVETRVRELIMEHGDLPAQAALEAFGESGLCNAINQYHGGFPVVRERLGLGTLQREVGFWKIWTHIEQELLPLVKKLGRFPTQGDLAREGKSVVAHAIHEYHGGFPAVQAKLGHQPLRVAHGYWDDWTTVESTLQPVIAELGRFPTIAELEARNMHGLLNGIRRHHGRLLAVRDRMGYGPVTDALIEQHAGTLARIIPALRPPDTDKFWSALKTRWVARDLTDAIAAFEADGSLERFEKLLDATSAHGG